MWEEGGMQILSVSEEVVPADGGVEMRRATREWHVGCEGKQCRLVDEEMRIFTRWVL